MIQPAIRYLELLHIWIHIIEIVLEARKSSPKNALLLDIHPACFWTIEGVGKFRAILQRPYHSVLCGTSPI
jgi:hypothetical protein